MTAGKLLVSAPAVGAVRERIDDELRCFVDGKAAAFVSDPELGRVFWLIRDYLLRGGKRLRPLLCYAGWRGAGGGGVPDGIVAAAASLEMFHAFALIHDDLMDGSDVRRGRPALHRVMAELHRRSHRAGDAEEAGRTLAILAGDLCFSWSGDLLHSCRLPQSRLRTAETIAYQMHLEVLRGQYLDVLGQRSVRSLAEAMEIARLKAARYTVEWPLLIGGVLAGADPAVLGSYHELAVPLGEAFQLRDDLIGVFGDPAVTGKSDMDDLREGKATALIALTRWRADKADLALIDRLYGKPGLTAGDAVVLREIMVRCGGRDAVERMIGERAERAGAVLARAPVDDGARALLAQLADLTTRRGPSTAAWWDLP
jgi:geranylgeranyl diphosphate synthase, type I